MYIYTRTHSLLHPFPFSISSLLLLGLRLRGCCLFSLPALTCHVFVIWFSPRHPFLPLLPSILLPNLLLVSWSKKGAPTSFHKEKPCFCWFTSASFVSRHFQGKEPRLACQQCSLVLFFLFPSFLLLHYSSSHRALVCHKLIIQPKMTLTSWYSCLYLPFAPCEFSTHHHACFMQDSNPGLP